MSLLAKRVAATKPAATSKPKGVSWAVGNIEEQQRISKAVSTFKELTAEKKKIEAKLEPVKHTLNEYGTDQLISHLSAIGVLPDTPMTIVNQDGDKITYVLQDRTGQHKVSSEQLSSLEAVFGEDAAQTMICQRTVFTLNPDLMADERVAKVVDEYLTMAVEALTNPQKPGDPHLTQEQAESIISVEQFRGFRPGLVDRLVEFAGKNTTKIRQLLDIMGSAVVKYVKA